MIPMKIYHQPTGPLYAASSLWSQEVAPILSCGLEEPGFHNRCWMMLDGCEEKKPTKRGKNRENVGFMWISGKNPCGFHGGLNLSFTIYI